MSYTKLDNVNALNANVKLVATLPTTPSDFYGSVSTDVSSNAWVGGEICLLTSDYKLYIQIATSGTTASWKRTADAAQTYTP